MAASMQRDASWERQRRRWTQSFGGGGGGRGSEHLQLAHLFARCAAAVLAGRPSCGERGGGVAHLSAPISSRAQKAIKRRRLQSAARKRFNLLGGAVNQRLFSCTSSEAAGGGGGGGNHVKGRAVALRRLNARAHSNVMRAQHTLAASDAAAAAAAHRAKNARQSAAATE